MKKQILSSAVAFGVLVGFTLSAQAGPVLSALKVDKDFQSGCGCSVSNKKDETLVFSDLEDKAPAIVRINGHLQKLPLVSTTEKQTPARMGERFTRLYSQGSTKLKIDYKTTFVCPAKDESCEVTRYSVKAAVRDGSGSTEMKGLTGDCGC